jgi:hypothetical protein
MTFHTISVIGLPPPMSSAMVRQPLAAPSRRLENEGEDKAIDCPLVRSLW